MSYWSNLVDGLDDLSCDELSTLGIERLLGGKYRYKCAFFCSISNELFIRVFKNEKLAGDSLLVYGTTWSYPEDELGNEDHRYQPHRGNGWLEYGQWCPPIEALMVDIDVLLEKKRQEAKARKEAEKEKIRQERRKYLAEFEEGFK